MSIKLRNKRSVGTGMASMSDLVFLLLIFFILVSTLVSPNAIDMKLPTTTNPNPTQVKNVEVHISPDLEFYITDEKHPITEEMVKDEVKKLLDPNKDGAVLLRADKTVPVQHIVNVLDAVNTINKETGRNHKVSLASEAK